MTEPILQVKDLSVYYNKKKALNSVSLDFAPKEITAPVSYTHLDVYKRQESDSYI